METPGAFFVMRPWICKRRIRPFVLDAPNQRTTPPHHFLESAPGQLLVHVHSSLRNDHSCDSPEAPGQRDLSENRIAIHNRLRAPDPPHHDDHPTVDSHEAARSGPCLEHHRSITDQAVRRRQLPPARALCSEITDAVSSIDLLMSRSDNTPRFSRTEHFARTALKKYRPYCIASCHQWHRKEYYRCDGIE